MSSISLLEKGTDNEQQLQVAVRTMAQLSHPQRLRVLCLLVEEGELSVAELLERVPLSASALSQHLAKMREEGLLSYRREHKNIIYSIQRDDIREILALLHKLYCSKNRWPHASIGSSSRGL